MASMVYKMVPVVQKEGKIRLFKSSDPANFADGGQCRDFIYIKDAVEMTCGFLSNTHGGIYNIGTGEATTWNQLAKAVFKALDKPVHIEYIDMPTDLKGQYQNFTRAEMQKYKTKTGIISPCAYTIESAVEDYVRNYLVKDARW
jgi:ADP-L-glycero-D-manno-heptose 6-epimerase